MKNSRFHPAIVLAVCVLSSISQPAGGDPPLSSEITTRLDLPGYWSNRLILDRGQTRMVAVSLRDIRDPERDFQAAGFGSPALAAGPLDAGGLLREVSNPLGYGPASDVFSETTGLSLRTIMAKSSRFGIWASVPGRAFSLGGYRNGEDISHAAAAVNLGGGTNPAFSGLMMVSNPGERLETDTWFPEKPLFPGGTLYHAAARMRVPFDNLTGAETRAGLSFGVSRGERTPAAGFVHAFGSHKSKNVEVNVLSGFCNEGYLTPGGAYPSLRTSHSAAVRLFPKGPLIPRAAAARDGYQVFRPTSPFRPSRRSLSAGAEYKTKNLSLNLEGTGKRERDAGGRESVRRSADASVRYRRNPLVISGQAGVVRQDDSEPALTAALEAEYRPKGWEFTARAGYGTAPVQAVTGKISCSIRRRGMNAGVSAELSRPFEPGDPLRYLVFSLFWRVRR